jgi:hypothetical protein
MLTFILACLARVLVSVEHGSSSLKRSITYMSWNIGEHSNDLLALKCLIHSHTLGVF